MKVPGNGRDFLNWASDISKAAFAVNVAAHMQRPFSLIDFAADGRCINLGEIDYTL